MLAMSQTLSATGAVGNNEHPPPVAQKQSNWGKGAASRSRPALSATPTQKPRFWLWACQSLGARKESELMEKKLGGEERAGPQSKFSQRPTACASSSSPPLAAQLLPELVAVGMPKTDM